MKLITVTAIILLIVALPLAADDAKAVFAAKCTPCHGANGTGDTPMGKNLGAKSLGSAEVQKKTDADLTKVIVGGSGKMPSFKQLTADQVAGLVKYIRGLAK